MSVLTVRASRPCSIKYACVPVAKVVETQGTADAGEIFGLVPAGTEQVAPHRAAVRGGDDQAAAGRVRPQVGGDDLDSGSARGTVR